MFENLSESQREIVDCDASRIIVKACPGSGKTYSVAARFARLLNKNDLSRHQGIAAISFTNTACEEIRKELDTEYSINDVRYPNFIGTIDSFINNYIFLPFGHLLMGCKRRPEIVGTEYNKWLDYDATIRNYNRTKIIDPDYFFDKISFDINQEPMKLVSEKEFNFSWKKRKNKNGTFRKDLLHIISAKEKHFSEGKANQADANYFAYKILLKYPSIAKNIAQRFPMIIVDEAQDTTTIQMGIIDLLDKAEIQSIMLIGDPDQAIFEWNTANPSLFINKYNSNNWERLELSENRRCSSNICSVLNQFFDGNMNSVAESERCSELPELRAYQKDNDSIPQIVTEFKEKCKEIGIADDSYAIVYRGHSFGVTHFKLINESSNIDNSMWINGKYYVRDIVYGKYLIDNGEYKKGLHLIEKGYLKETCDIKYVSASKLKEEVDKKGYRSFRQALFRFINSLPPTTNQTLNNWIINANRNGNSFSIESIKANIDISQIFHNETITISPSSCYKTIHSVKGMSLDAILVFLTEKDHSNYSTILPKNYDTLPLWEKEQIRTVYVACSRPKKLLWLAVPSGDINCWKIKLKL